MSHMHRNSSVESIASSTSGTGQMRLVTRDASPTCDSCLSKHDVTTMVKSLCSRHNITFNAAGTPSPTSNHN